MGQGSSTHGGSNGAAGRATQESVSPPQGLNLRLTPPLGFPGTASAVGLSDSVARQQRQQQPGSGLPSLSSRPQQTAGIYAQVARTTPPQAPAAVLSGEVSVAGAAAVSSASPAAAPAAGQGADVPRPVATAPLPAAATRTSQLMYKHTTLIPGWSRSLSSQHLHTDCQQVVSHPVARADGYAVLDMEVMKFVAYCGGVTVRFRLEELPAAAAAGEKHSAAHSLPLSWGLACTKPCPALSAHLSTCLTAPSTPGTGASSTGSGSLLECNGAGGVRGGSQLNSTGTTTPSSTEGVTLDSPSRKGLFLMCQTSTASTALRVHDVVSLELAPREGGQPVIVATLRLNNEVLCRQSLPCNQISTLQMYPFLHLPPGTAVSLHEATTPSPLFTWFPAASNSVPDITLAELDTCVKYNSQPGSAAHAQAHLGVQADFGGSTSFSRDRHRWTVQLDNFGVTPAYIFVGVAASTAAQAGPSAGSSVLTGVQGPLRSIAGGGAAAGASALAGAPAVGAGTRPIATGATGSAAFAGSRPLAVGAVGMAASVAASTGTRSLAAGAVSMDTDTAMSVQTQQWGVWVRVPGVASPVPALGHPPAREGGLAHVAEATTSHCFVTVDLDLANGFVRFFRNGHLIGHPFQGVSGTVSPLVAFVQGVAMSCQAGLVNITKLRQLDLSWNSSRCSADLKLAGPVVSKVSEVYGDYSTVLANKGFISGVHLWLVKINNLSEPDSIFLGVCRGCMPLDQDPQDLRDRTYYLSNGVIRVGGRRVATSAANFTKGDTVGVVLDADQGEIVFFRNGTEQGRARGIRGRLFPFVSCDSEGDQVTLVGSYKLLLNRIPRHLADMEWDTVNHAQDVELSSNCLTATKSSSVGPSTVRGTILYAGMGTHEFHVILDTIGPDGVWVGVAPPDMDPTRCVGDPGCGWALHSDGDKRFNGREEEFTAPFKNGDVLSVVVDGGTGILRFARNGQPLGEAFVGLTGHLVSAATLASEESKITIQNRPTVLNTGEYTGELRWDEGRAGKDLNVIDGLTVTKMANEGGDYATVLGTLCLSSGQHTWNVYINHVEDSNLFIGVTVGGHDLNADPQEMKARTYYLSNGTIRVAGKLVTRCAEPYAEGDLVSLHLDMDTRHVRFLKNGVVQGAGDGLPEEVWPYVSLDNIMDSITLHSSHMFVDLLHSLRWNPAKACRLVTLGAEGAAAQLRALGGEETVGQGTVLGLREYHKAESHSWVVRMEQSPTASPSNFLVGVAPPGMDLNRSLGEEGCGIGLDYFGYFYTNGRYFHASNLANWSAVSKPVRGSTAKHKGKAQPIFSFVDGKCEITVTLDLKEGTLRFTQGGRTIGTLVGVQGPLHAAITLTSSKQQAVLGPGPIGRMEHTNEELVNILKGKGCQLSSRLEAALLAVPRELFVPRDRQREAFRDQKLTVRMSDGSVMTMPPPSFVALALERLGLGTTTKAFLDVGCGTGYVAALAACLVGDTPGAVVQGIECVPSRLEGARANMRALRERLACPQPLGTEVPGLLVPLGPLQLLGDPIKLLAKVELSLANVLSPECTDGVLYDALYCDVAVSEEDLPALLALLRPSGRLVVLLEEEAVLVTRTGTAAHNFTREVLCPLSGEFGELEDPTPWEMQEAIQRVKERERRRGHEQAKQDMSSLRSFEYVEMQQRVQSAMQRISELESMLARAELHPLRSPARPQSVSISSRADPLLRSPLRASSVADDVRMALKDKGRRGLGVSSVGLATGVSSAPKLSPRGTPSLAGGLGHPTSSMTSPMPSMGVADSGDWKAMYTTEGSSPGARMRARELLAEPDQGTPSEVSDAEGEEAVGALLTGTGAGLSYLSGRGLPDLTCCDNDDSNNDGDDGNEDEGYGSGDAASSVAEPTRPPARVSMHSFEFEDIIDSMSVQMFTPEQVASIVAGSEFVQVEGRDVYHGSFKGVRVRVWRVGVGHGVSYVELKQAYSKYCIAHPNICAVLGVCIQPAPPPCNHLNRSMSVVERLHPIHLSSPPTGLTAHHRAGSAGRFPSIDLKRDRDEKDTGSGKRAAAALLKSAPRTGGVSREDSGLSSAFPEHTAASFPALRSWGPPPSPQVSPHTLWVVEESFGEESLHARLERGLLSWQQVCRIAMDICKALAFLQDLKRHSLDREQQTAPWAGPGSDSEEGYSEGHGSGYGPSTQQGSAVLSAYALRTTVTPFNVQVDTQSTKVSVLPALLNHLEAVLGGPSPSMAPQSPSHCDMAYIDPHSLFSEASAPSFYAFGVVMLQLLTEQGPLGLVSAVKEALDGSTLMNLVPRLPVNAQMAAWAVEFAQLTLRCTLPGAVAALEAELLPALEELSGRLGALGSSAMSWEQVEEMLMLPLQPRTNVDSAARRWVRQDFRMRRKMFMEEVAKLAAESPINKIEVRRGRCFKDSMAMFAGKGHAIWRQPLKVTFLGEAGMDSGGVSREWFSSLSSAISRDSPELFWSAGPQRNQLYIHPQSASPAHLKKFQFVGLFMAKAILESSARGKELGPITLNLPFCEPLWKLLLGLPLNLMDLQLLDPTEFRSLMSILDMDIDGLIFEVFAWEFHQAAHALPTAPSSQGFGQGAGYVAATIDSRSQSATQPTTPRAGAALNQEPTTPKANLQHSAAALSSPFALVEPEDSQVTSIPLKPGGTHLKVTNQNKREYVLLKAHKMLVGTVEQQMTAIIDAFHSIIPRDLIEKYGFTSLEMQLLVCGEQRVDVQDLRRNCKYEDGYTGKEECIQWFWDAVESFDDTHRRLLLQFWSGSDGMPAEGFGALDPAFHLVAVERLYDPADTTARLPAAHTCFRQLDMPRYRSAEELKEKVTTAITIGQGFMALS